MKTQAAAAAVAHWLQVEPGCIPQVLIDRPQWMIWRPELTGERWSKAPRDPVTGRLADKCDPQHWGAIHQALEGMERHGAQGIGFCLCPGDGLVIADLDHCGASDPWAWALVDRLASYTERSPSGVGLRIVMQGAKPADSGCRWRIDGRELEVYDGGAFLTITGHHVPGTPWTVRDRTAELAALAPASRAQPLPPPPPRASAHDDVALIERAHRAQNGATFGRLWRGDLVDAGGDWSRADWQLCLRLKYWTGGDPERMDRLFRQSGLYREKWDRLTGSTTYGQRTIIKALGYA